jgi:hypothetical protein
MNHPNNIPWYRQWLSLYRIGFIDFSDWLIGSQDMDALKTRSPARSPGYYLRVVQFIQNSRMNLKNTIIITKDFHWDFQKSTALSNPEKHLIIINNFFILHVLFSYPHVQRLGSIQFLLFRIHGIQFQIHIANVVKVFFHVIPLVIRMW